MVESMVFCKCYLNNLKTIWKYSWNSPFFINLKKAFIYKHVYPMFLFLFFKCFGDISDIPNTFPICALEALRCLHELRILHDLWTWDRSNGISTASGHWSPGRPIKPLRLRTVGHLSQSFLVPGWKHLNMTGSSRFFFGSPRWGMRYLYTHPMVQKIMVFNNFFTKATDWWFS